MDQIQPFWWKYIVDLAQIFSAVGTCAAVIVALKIARAPPKLHVRGHVGLRILIGGFIPDHVKPEYLHVSVTNCGANEFVINSFAWEMRHRDDLAAIQVMNHRDAYASCDPLPKKLILGETANYFLPAMGLDDWFMQCRLKDDFFRMVFDERQALDGLRLSVVTSVGTIYRLKPEKKLLDRIWENIEAGNLTNGPADPKDYRTLRQKFFYFIKTRINW